MGKTQANVVARAQRKRNRTNELNHEGCRYEEHHCQEGSFLEGPGQEGRRQGLRREKDRWAGLAEDSGPGNDQMDIHRGRGMITQEFQGAAGIGGTHNTIQTSSDYMSQGLKT